MEDLSKVFKSNITRIDCQEKNNLCELLQVIPAKPIPVKHEESVICEFTPKTDKYYIPKKRSKLKVKTVKYIRDVFEQDIYSFLNNDLERQQNFLLRKIRVGSSSNENTKLSAKKIMNADCPLSRSCWQILNNLNPYDFSYPKQFVVSKGKFIQVCGSKGGNNKLLFNYDKNINKSISSKCKSIVEKTRHSKRKGLLQNSLAVKFKPGPLRKKKFLDDSHQKYHLGQIELIEIPRPALEVKPTYGVVLDSFVSNLLSNFRDENGAITRKWADLAVSVLGQVENKTVVQANRDCITFDLKYNLDKKRILMRRDIENIAVYDTNNKSCNHNVEDNLATDLEVQNAINDIINTVEICLKQDNMYSVDDDQLPFCNETSIKIQNIVKEKSKKKYSSELDRLAVTVIKLPESSINSNNSFCGKDFCRLGCVCESLNQPFYLKQHCGKLNCMFGCKCKKSKYKDLELLENCTEDLIPGLLNLDKVIHSSLAKEEQKFHQTVILSGEKSILLKERKRNRKFTKKYADFYCKTPIDYKAENKKVLTIVATKLNCANIEPWCMVHNLYRCFCKGKFTKSSVSLKSNFEQSIKPETEVKDTTTVADRNPSENNKIKEGHPLRTRIERKFSHKNDDLEIVEVPDNSYTSSCARTSRYKGRKYSDGYYRNMNNKILEMEKNDVSMQKKILKLAKRNENNDTRASVGDTHQEIPLLEASVITSYDSQSSDDVVLMKTAYELDDQNNDSSNLSEGIITQKLPCAENKIKLVSWLETSYKNYKQRAESGIAKSSLEAPKKGKLALHTWELILSRYSERKNLFLVSKEEPYRVFLAVDQDNPFFDSCMNIDDIRFADLNKYPAVVRNLLTNATDLKDNFCILNGRNECWELVGSVTKVAGKAESIPQFSTEKFVSQKLSNDDDTREEFETVAESNCSIKENDILKVRTLLGDQSERSKWFLMTIENDFSEMRFYNRGFYVKHLSVIQAIDLARVSGKTVRLSSQVGGDKNTGPQFGIYATPNINQLCVFVGPYEINEQLGLETIKNLDVRKGKKTRGVWITSNKVDNMQVINDPLSFIPTKIEQSEIIVSQEVNDKADSDVQLVSPNIDDENDKLDKTPRDKLKVKPITIRKTNGFYHLSSSDFLKKMVNNKSSILRSQGNTLLLNPESSLLKTDNSKNSAGVSGLKITSVYSEKAVSDEETVKPEKNCGMLILKPDEINKKLLQAQTQLSDAVTISHVPNVSSSETIEPSASTTVPTNTNDEILYISDDDDICREGTRCKDIWIQTSNAQELGWIVGMQKDEDKISFLLPGSKQYSFFYSPQEAFKKIRQFLMCKQYISTDKHLEWEIVDTLDKVRGQPLSSLRKNRGGSLPSQDMGLFSRGQSVSEIVIPKEDVEIRNYKSNFKNKNTSTPSQFLKFRIEPVILYETSNTLRAMEETSRLLEDETLLLWNEAKTKENEIITCLKQPENISTAMSNELQSILKDFEVIENADEVVRDGNDEELDTA